MKKIIISTVVIALVLCIGIAALVMALIPVGANDRVQLPNHVYIYNAQTYETHKNANKRLELKNRVGEDEKIAKINKIYNCFNHGFQQKALAALFSGELNLGTEVEYSKAEKRMSKNYEEENKFTVVFYYSEEQKVTFEGKEYSYNYLFFEVSSNNSREEVVMGLDTSVESDEGQYPIEYISYKYSLKTKANFIELYNYLSDLVD